eukprot:3721797-Lingulodinium_polyedra.AAC.1
MHVVQSIIAHSSIVCERMYIGHGTTTSDHYAHSAHSMTCQCYDHAVLVACDQCAVHLRSICDPRRAFRNPHSTRRPPHGG